PRIEGGERLDPQVDADVQPGLRPGTRLVLTDDTGIPAIGPTADRTSLRDAVQRTVGAEAQGSDLRQGEATLLELHAVAPLREGEAVIPAATFEARIARVLPVLAPAEERLKGTVYAVQHVLRHLGMDGGKKGVRDLLRRERGALAGKAGA